MYSSMREVKKAVDKNHGFLTISMGHLRDIYGASCLKRLIIEGISDDLHTHGLAHYPATLPNDQSAQARIYIQDSYIGKIIDAVLNNHENNDAVLRRTATREEAKLLKQIRDIVGSYD